MCDPDISVASVCRCDTQHGAISGDTPAAAGGLLQIRLQSIVGLRHRGRRARAFPCPPSRTPTKPTTTECSGASCWSLGASLRYHRPLPPTTPCATAEAANLITLAITLMDDGPFACVNYTVPMQYQMLDVANPSNNRLLIIPPTKYLSCCWPSFRSLGMQADSGVTFMTGQTRHS